MTIYRMYTENGDRAGFFVQHRSWANACARVRSIAGLRRGKLPGRSPSYDNAPVELEWFDVRSGRELPTSPVAAIDPQDKHYSSIATPWWSRPRPAVVPVFSPVSAGGSNAS
jgi:hypothetical protein